MNRHFWVFAFFVSLTTVATAQNTYPWPSSGDIGIGTNGPLSPLSVSGQVVIGNPYRGDASLHITAAYGCCGRYTQMDVNGPSQNVLNLMGSSDSNGNAHYFAWGVNAGSWTISPGESFGSAFTINGSGSVGIGTSTPAQLLEVNGNAQVDGSLQLGRSGVQITSSGVVFPNGGGTQTAAWTGTICGGDFAESVNVFGDRKRYEPGDVLVIDPKHPGGFVISQEPYSTAVLGVYSTKPGVVGRRLTTPKDPDEVPMAMVGIVPTKVSAENGPIHPGDLLVTSSMPGYAMKGNDRSRMLGAVIGKALGSLETGTGTIEAGIVLQ